MLVITAGSLMHMLIAVVLLFAVYSIRRRDRRRPGAEVRRPGERPGRGSRHAVGRHRDQHRRVVIDASDELGEAVRSHQPGDVVTVVVVRDGERVRRSRSGSGRTPTRPARRSGTALLGVGSRAATRVAGDVARCRRYVQRHRPVPDGVGVAKGVVKVLNPVNICRAPQRGDRRPGDAADHASSASPRSAATSARPRGSIGVLLPARRRSTCSSACSTCSRCSRSTAGTPRSPPTSGSASANGQPLLRRRLQADAVRDGRDRRAAVPVHVRSLPRHHPAGRLIGPVKYRSPPERGRRVRSTSVRSPSGAARPITVQSMTITKTADVEGTLQQIYALAAAGCDIVRCTCNEMEAAEGLAQIVPRSPVPIIADIHHQYRMALAAMEAGVHGSAPQPRQHPQARAHQGRGVRGAGPPGADPDRGQRRLARPGAVREARRRHARGDGRVGAAGDGVLRRGRLRPRSRSR